MKKYLFLLFAALAFLASCTDKPEKIDPPKGDVSKGIFIVNEGTFTFGNASLSLYNPDSQKVENDIFNRINNRPIGDVFQSMYVFNDNYFCMVNNMQKIEVLNSQTLKSEAVIEGLNAPRYFQPINTSKAYVTDLYANGIWIINPTTYQKTGKIDFQPDKDTALNNWAEQLILYNNEAFVCIPRQKKLIVINTDTDKITDTISLSAQPQWIQKDKNNHVWILADGAIDHVNSKLYCIDPENKSIIRTFTFNSNKIAVSELKMNASADTLYYIYKDVYKMTISEVELPQTPVISAGSKQIYGLGIDPKTSEIYISDAIDNIQPGKVYRYNSNGKLIHDFQVGVSPGEFLFIQ
ncbi:MAG: YncE family protein [Sphingobacteriales bacterium]|nr:MAG: YncE family protein [Sphingobacteriales bacterium]